MFYGLHDKRYLAAARMDEIFCRLLTENCRVASSFLHYTHANPIIFPQNLHFLSHFDRATRRTSKLPPTKKQHIQLFHAILLRNVLHLGMVLASNHMQAHIFFLFHFSNQPTL